MLVLIVSMFSLRVWFAMQCFNKENLELITGGNFISRSYVFFSELSLWRAAVHEISPTDIKGFNLVATVSPYLVIYIF